MNEALNASWNYPTSIDIGAGNAHAVGSVCNDLGLKNILVVTDSGLVDLPIFKELFSAWSDAGLTLNVFSDVQSNPTGENVDTGALMFRELNCQAVIAVGGGSALDVGKAIALMSGQTLPLWAFEDIGDNWTQANLDGIAPSIAIPTTAGTGSEVGRASVITDTAQKVKRIIFHPQMMPKRVILDPNLSVSLPKALTAATGMDALSHNLEAYCARCYHPMADGIAMQAIAMIKEFLPLAYEMGDSLQARTQMLVASAMGATAFQKGLGAMHALAHPLGAIYNAHHGRLNAILMPYVLQANREAIESKIEKLATFLTISNGFEGFIDWILTLRQSLNIEHSLREIGIDDTQVDKIATMATEDAASSGNPISFSANDYAEILHQAIDGAMHR